MGALERDEFLRATWRVMVAEQVETERLIFVDEMGTNTSLSPVYAWAPKGQRAYWSVPRNRGANTTVLSSMSTEGMGPSLTVEGTTTSVVFEDHFCGAGPGAKSALGSGGGDGQPLGPQRREDQRVDRAAG